MRYTKRNEDGFVWTARDSNKCLVRLAELEDKIESGELVEVVRCRDCMFYAKMRRRTCNLLNAEMLMSDYCRNGVKK